MRGCYTVNEPSLINMNSESIITIDSICFSYPNDTRKVLNHCSLNVQPGELITILGPNGAGKSTLLNCACGLLKPQQGSVKINGTILRRLKPREIARAIGYVQQKQQSSFAYSVFDYVLMGRSCHIKQFCYPSEEDKKRVHDVLDEMGIADLSSAAITEISGGEQQLAAIARAIVQDPQVIFFDEPTAHLDYGNQIRMLRLIKNLSERGFSIVMTTHTPDHCIILGGTVAILDRDGTLITGKTNELITNNTLAAIYNADVLVVDVPVVNRKVCIPKSI